MLKEERHTFILDEVRTKHKVLTLELSQFLHVSEDTIRRDLKELADLGQIKKVHGGAVSHSLNPFHYRDREVYAQEEKIAIAEKSLELFQNNQVVLMDGGTSNLELARRFPPELHLTVFTNSIPIAAELSDHPNIEIIFTGGKLLKNAQVTVGPEVIQTLSGIRADICVLGTRSIHHQIGISEIDWDETKVKRAMIESAQEVVALVIHEKLETTQPYIIAETRKITTLVTSLERKDPRLRPYFEMGVELL